MKHETEADRVEDRNRRSMSEYKYVGSSRLVTVKYKYDAYLTNGKEWKF